MANRNRVLAPEEDAPRRLPRPARPVRGPRPAGSMGIPARAQHDRRRRGPRGRPGRHRSGPDPFTAVLGLVRAGLHADTRCGHCGKLPADPLGQLIDDATAHPGHRPGRMRTSGRTPAERRSRPTEEATYTITITPSNLPQWRQTP